MCSSFKQEISNEALVKNLSLVWSGRTGDYPAKYELFPSHHGRVITSEAGKPTLQSMFWSILFRNQTEVAIPKGYATHNAKSETVTTSRLYGPPWKQGRRCVVPVTAFKEPFGEKGKKVWLDIKAKDLDLTMIAGLYDITTGGTHSFTLLTCAPNQFMTRIHHRMPVILEDWKAWLSSDLTPDQALGFLRPWPHEMTVEPDPF